MIFPTIASFGMWKLAGLEDLGQNGLSKALCLLLHNIQHKNNTVHVERESGHPVGPTTPFPLLERWHSGH